MICGQTAYAEMLLFVSDSCSFCQKLEEQLSAKDYFSEFSILRFEISKDEDNRLFYMREALERDYTEGQVPLLIDGDQYYAGASKIMEYLEQLNTETPAPSQLTAEDSNRLNDMLKASVIPTSEPPPATTSNTTKNIGIIAIIFGLTLFGAIMWRAKKKR